MKINDFNINNEKVMIFLHPLSAANLPGVIFGFLATVTAF